VEVESEITNIMAAIKAGILTSTTEGVLEAAEAERERLLFQMDRNGNGKVAECCRRRRRNCARVDRGPRYPVHAFPSTGTSGGTLYKSRM
jgi:hypothetical protein